MKQFHRLVPAIVFSLLGLAGSAAQAQVRLDAGLATVVDDLVAANRILFNQGVVDGFGHVSARSPADPTHFFMARSIAPSIVTSTDIMEFDADGKPVGNDSRQPYAERFIHSEIYRTRPDVKAVVHAHSPAVIAFGVANVPLRPVYHMSAFLGHGTPIFDTRDTARPSPETDLLVKNAVLGAKLAEKLGSSSVVLMRGHGFTAVAGSVPVVVFRAIYTDQNARIQADALKLGTPRFLSEQEAAMAQATMEPLSVRSWEMWRRQAGLVP
jgi:ribulose-5-phosphate 4-epimerase/fuculose-1-phosphate aldolase